MTSSTPNPLSADLLALLRCPETLQPLRIASQESIGLVNCGGLRNRSGTPVELPLASALETEDGALIYPIREGIPLLLIEEAISLPGTASSPQLRSDGDPL